MSIEISLKSDANLGPGELVCGSVIWNLEKEPQQVTVSLLWYTEGLGTQDSEVVAQQVFDFVGRKGQQDFEFTMPLGPYSYEGRNLSILWSLEAEPKKGKDLAECALVLAPGGVAVSI